MKGTTKFLQELENDQPSFDELVGLKNDFEITHALNEAGTLKSFPLVKSPVSAFEATEKGTIDLVLIAGYSGIGKTRLINEIHKPIAKLNGYFTSGKFDQYNRNNPYSGIAAAFSSLIKQFLAESTESFNYWKQRILSALGENVQVIIDVIPELEILTDKQSQVLKLGLNETQSRFFKLFEKFLKVFASEEHPLVIFIDDLQWADSGSLELLYALLNSKNIQHTLFIGAYRNNEVSPSHPLMLTLNRLTSNGKEIKTITLTEPNKDDVNQLIADSLHHQKQHTSELTEVVMKKTSGNPFFINRFIQKLVQDNLIYFETAEGKWKWDAKK